MSADITKIVQATCSQHVIGTQQFRGQATVVIRREGLLDVARLLKTDPAAACDVLMDLTCVDYLKFGASAHSAPRLATPSPLPYYMDAKPMAETWERGVSANEHRFDLVYHVYSTAHHHRLRLRVPIASSDPSAPSLTALWESANWLEREVWDMFGIRFTGHPNLRRILMYEEFQGHPLRKDYPIRKRQPLIGPVN